VIGAVNELSGPRECRRLRGGLDARRPPQAVAHARCERATTSNTAISTMGYEIAGGLGVKLADPSARFYVMVGDGSYLMMAQGARDLDPGGAEAHDRAGGQRGLRVNRRSVAIGRARRIGTRYQYRTNGSLVAIPQMAAANLCRSTLR